MNTLARTGRMTPKAALCIALVVALASWASADTQSAARVVPSAPERVIAVALQEAAIVAWLLPDNSSEAPPITSYTITAFDNESPLAVAATTKARAAGAVVHRLTSGHCYSFRVHASNAAGNGPDSEASEPICLMAEGADIQLTMAAPMTADPGSLVAFTLTVTNNGTADAALVSVADIVPAPLAAFTTSQGVCQGAVGGRNFGCNLGAIQSGASATVTVTMQMGNADITNTAWASAYNASGATLPDPLPANNAGSATVKVVAAAGN